MPTINRPLCPTQRPDSTDLAHSAHAQCRQDERGLPDWAVEFALRWGTRLHRRGATLFHVRRKDLPAWLEERHARRLHGVTAVVADGVLVTAYCRRGGFRALKRDARVRRVSHRSHRPA